MSAPFDPDRMELTGVATAVAEGLQAPSGGWNFYAASQTGVLLYSTGAPANPTHEVVWVTRDGAVTSIDPEWTFDPGANNRGLALSPDDTRLAVVIRDAQDRDNYDIWLKELPRGPVTRLTFNPGLAVRPRWTPDGQALTYLATYEGVPADSRVYSSRASGTGDPTELMDHELSIWEAWYSPDMEWLIARTGGTTTVPGGRDIWALGPGDTEPVALVSTDYDEKAISLSPDGRWLLYESDETSRNEVYVRRFPNVEDGKWTVSTGGGVMPVWAHGGGEIFYVNAANEMIVASVETGPSFRVTDRTTLFSLPSGILFVQGEQYPLYDVAQDDERFVMFRSVEALDDRRELIRVSNWTAELSGRTPN